MDEDRVPPPPDDEAIARRLREAGERARLAAAAQGSENSGTDAARLERLEAQVEIGGRTEMPALDEDPLDGRLREMEERVRKTTASRDAASAHSDRIRTADRDSARGAGLGLSAAYALMGLPLMGAAIGYGLNRLTGGNAWLPIFTLAGMVAGIWFVSRLTDRP